MRLNLRPTAMPAYRNPAVLGACWRVRTLGARRGVAAIVAEAKRLRERG